MADDQSSNSMPNENIDIAPKAPQATRGRSASRKRQLSSNSAELMKPPAIRQRSASVSRRTSVQSSSPQSKPVTFKTQGESFNLSDLVQKTLVQSNVIQAIVPSVVNEIKNELVSELKKDLTSVVSEAVKSAIAPLQLVVSDQNRKIENILAENEKLKRLVDERCGEVDARYEKFRNIANSVAKYMSENQKNEDEQKMMANEFKSLNVEHKALKTDLTNIKLEQLALRTENETLKSEIASLRVENEELEQYGRRTSLRFHNVPITRGQLQMTDDLIVDIVNNKLKLERAISAEDINRSHIIGEIKGGKAQLICRFRNWKIKNAIYMAKKTLKDDPDKIFITEDLTRTRQALMKQLYNHRREKRLDSFWTFDGRIFATKEEGAPRRLIKNIEDIEALVH